MVDLEERMGAALGAVGCSITLTSLTDGLAFCIGSLIDLPAVSAFCVAAGVAVISVFIVQSTFFVELSEAATVLHHATWRGHLSNVEALLDANVDFVSLANGHSLDFREDGLFDTWEALDAAAIAHAGSRGARSSPRGPLRST